MTMTVLIEALIFPAAMAMAFITIVSTLAVYGAKMMAALRLESQPIQGLRHAEAIQRAAHGSARGQISSAARVKRPSSDPTLRAA